MSALHELARAAGLQIDWIDATNTPQRVAEPALKAVLAALGFLAGSEGEIADSRRRVADQEAQIDFVSAELGEPIALPGFPDADGELVFEDGARREARVEGAHIPAIDRIGYHRLIVGDRIVRLAIAPPRCFEVADAAPRRRIWAPAVQLYSLRDDRPSAFGDFGTLAHAARAFGAWGADALAISPTHALFPADPSRYSPYAPSSRLFLNVLFADPAVIGEALPEEASPDLIDWHAAIPARLAALRAIHDRMGDALAGPLAAFRRIGGDELERHARFDALHAHFFAASGAKGWRDWPAAFHDPAGDAVAHFAANHGDDVDFFLFLQWLARQSLEAAQKAGTEAGMAIGLIADLAVGMDPGGSHAWGRPGDLLTGLSIGAPPDLLGPDGQNWGITGFSPQALRRTGFDAFIATLRAAIDHAGGIRIDHALGLRRLWVIPDGASAKDGAYLTMPQDDLLRVIAIESHRSRAIVIGEDLGTVPPGLREAMQARGMLGMRVLPFERDDGGFIAPDRWSPQAAAMTGTHDLPTVSGWWRERDIDWTWALGRTSRADDEADDRAQRAADRASLWQAFEGAGLVDRPQPEPWDTDPVVKAALGYVGETPCVLAIAPIEDIAGLIEQPNLPGTITEHPNWRRRMPEATDALLDRPEVAARIDALTKARNP